MLPRRGRVGAPLILLQERDLELRDLADLGNPRNPLKAPPMVQRLKASHHLAAKLLAGGLSLREVASRVGRTAQRIGDMQRTDPAFQNLIAYYAAQLDPDELDDLREMQGMFRSIGLDALEEIQERLADDKIRGSMPTAELRQLAATAADRTDAPNKAIQAVNIAPTKIVLKLGPRDIRPLDETPGEGQGPPIEHQSEDESPKED